MKENVAFDIASKMMSGKEVNKFDEISKSAISELANMISGNVCTIFFGKGKEIDITTPSFKIDASPEDFPTMQENANIVCIPLKFNNGNVFEIDILLY